jgi:hypothetical protein
MHGEPLRSYGGWVAANGIHAIFWPRIAMQIDATHQRGVGSGTVALVVADQVRGRTSSTPLWLFRYDAGGELVQVIEQEARRHPKIAFPRDAVVAAAKKSLTISCKYAVWADGFAARPPIPGQTLEEGEMRWKDASQKIEESRLFR